MVHLSINRRGQSLSRSYAGEAMAIFSALDLGIAALWLICLAIIFRACRPTNVLQKPAARRPAGANQRSVGSRLRASGSGNVLPLVEAGMPPRS